MRKSILVISMGLLGCIAASQGSAQVTGSPSQPKETPRPTDGPAGVTKKDKVTVLRVPHIQAQAGAARIDYAKAIPFELPRVAHRSNVQAQYDLMDTLRSQLSLGQPGHSAGRAGTGAKKAAVKLGAASAFSGNALGVSPQEFGTTDHPFSTSQADWLGRYYPSAPAGKLFFNIGDQTYQCSASLIKRGVVVTAAHCVANFGNREFYSNWRFSPGYYSDGSYQYAPYGEWTVQSATVMTSYFDGSDACAQSGVICQDDVAVLLLNPSDTGDYPGTATGWYGYGWNGWGFTSNGLTQITQLGYPVCLDYGRQMERNDSYGYRSSSLANNTIIGSLMCGGSSGGPWLANFGIRPALTDTSDGAVPDSNMVIGVTSWGYTDSGAKEQGGSAFTSGNIVPVVDVVCGVAPAACK